MVPLCHTIELTSVKVELTFKKGLLEIEGTVKTVDRTGVEMEALTAACASALTVYDMVKSVDRGLVIEDVGLLQKSGGRSGTWQRKESKR